MKTPDRTLTLTRRDALGGTARLACAALAGILADPQRAHAAAQSLETVRLQTADGRSVSAALAKPAGRAKAPAVLVIHEWWGLNDQIKAFSQDLSEKGYLVLAVDLMSGASTTDPNQAQRQMEAVKPAEAQTTLKAWIAWLKAHRASTGKIATMGFCFGGGWSLNASLAAPVDGTIIYYGRVDKTADELRALKGPVLGHFAERDGYINGAMVAAFQRAMAEAGKTVTVYWYDADHGFANPTTARYDEDDTARAYARSLAFLDSILA